MAGSRPPRVRPVLPKACFRTRPRPRYRLQWPTMRFPVSILAALMLLATPACKRKKPEPLPSDAAYADVLSRVKETRKVDQEVDRVQEALRDFQRIVGRLPSTLEEMVRLGYLDKIPVAPAGMRFHYDARYGNFRMLTLEQYDYLMRMQPR